MSTNPGNGVPDSEQIVKGARQFVKGMPTVVRAALIIMVVGVLGRWAFGGRNPSQ